jgi:ribonuclease BN (tRNA processing enzyme)
MIIEASGRRPGAERPDGWALLGDGGRSLYEARKTVKYCTNTGMCSGLRELARDADLLIAECSYLLGEQHPEWPHLNPEEAAGVAREAGARRLVLTHFDAGRYTSEGKRNKAGVVARRIFRDTLIAKDGMEITID